jgi:Methyltransferase domain
MNSVEYRYDSSFMGLAARAQRSARVIVDLVRSALSVASVADFGCALGTWLSEWRRRGVEDVIGVDGPYVRIEDLEIPPQLFRSHDLTSSIDLGRRFDLVECMEVAEHLPDGAADRFVACLVRHADVVLFSAAPPGQGGENHVNEQPYEYWRALFTKYGYHMFDWLRPQIAGRTDVQFWYRYNVFLFVAEERIAALPPPIRASEVLPGERIRDLSPWTFKVRKVLIRRLPPGLQNGISRAMSRLRLRGL